MMTSAGWPPVRSIVLHQFHYDHADVITRTFRGVAKVRKELFLYGGSKQFDAIIPFEQRE